MIVELGDQGDEQEPAESRDELGLAPVPAAEPGDERGRVDHLALAVTIKLVG